MRRSPSAATSPRASGETLGLSEGPGSVVISSQLQSQIRLLVNDVGEVEALRCLGISRTGLLRSLGGLPQRPATIMWLGQRMAAVKASAPPYEPGAQVHGDGPWSDR